MPPIRPSLTPTEHGCSRRRTAVHPRSLCPHQPPRASAVGLQSGRAGQQPQRQARLGAAAAAVCRSGLSVAQVGLLAALYPAVWGLGQLVTGPLSDRLGRKPLITGGMLLQAIALAGTALAGFLPPWAAGAILLGVGTAMVCPTLLAAISDVAHPNWRATAVGVYRLWRDAGFAVGALLAGLVADLAGLEAAVWVVAVLTAAPGSSWPCACIDPPGGQGVTADRSECAVAVRDVFWPPTCCPSTGSWPTRSPTGWAARSSWWSAAPSTSSNRRGRRWRDLRTAVCVVGRPRPVGRAVGRTDAGRGPTAGGPSTTRM